MSDMGYKYQVAFFVSRVIKEDKDFYEIEKFSAKLKKSGKKKYNDITKTKSSDRNERISEYEVKSSTGKNISAQQIKVAIAQIVASFIINGDWNNQECFLVFSNRKEEWIELKETIKDKWLTEIKKLVESYLIKIKSINPFNQETFNQVFDKIKLIKIIKKNVDGDIYYSEYEEEVKKKFQISLMKSFKNIDVFKLDLLFAKVISTFNNGNCNMIRMNLNVLKMFLINQEIIWPEQTASLLKWVKKKLNNAIYEDICNTIESFEYETKEATDKFDELLIEKEIIKLNNKGEISKEEVEKVLNNMNTVVGKIKFIERLYYKYTGGEYVLVS